MSSSVDFTYGNDELDRAQIKPWWESGMSYGIQLMFVASFTTMYIVDSTEIDVKCVQTDLNFSSVHMRDEYVERKCYFQLSKLIRYPGTGGLMGTTVAYLLCNWWTGKKSMRDAFRTIAKTELIFTNENITRSDVKAFVDRHKRLNVDAFVDRDELLKEDKLGHIEFAVDFIRTHIKLRKKGLMRIYAFASAVRFVLFCVADYYIFDTFFGGQEGLDMYGFNCNITFDEKEPRFRCVSDIGMKNIVFGIVALCLAIMIVVCSFIGIGISTQLCTKCRAKKQNSETSDNDMILCNGSNLAFMKRFYGNRSTLSRCVIRLLEYAEKEESGEPVANELHRQLETREQ